MGKVWWILIYIGNVSCSAEEWVVVEEDKWPEQRVNALEEALPKVIDLVQTGLNEAVNAATSVLEYKVVPAISTLLFGAEEPYDGHIELNTNQVSYLESWETVAVHVDADKPGSTWIFTGDKFKKTNQPLSHTEQAAIMRSLFD